MFLIKQIGFNQLQKKLTNISRRLSDRRTINARAVVVIDRWIQKNFQSEGQLAQSGGWKKLSSVTIAMRRKGKGKGSPRILQDTGALKTRWKHLWTHTSAKVQSMVNYGIKHDKGIGVPKRPVLPTEEQIWPELRKIHKDWIINIIK